MSATDIQRIILAMDVSGWEQDGKGKTFINVAGNKERKKERKTFRNWTEVYNFVLKINGK